MFQLLRDGGRTRSHNRILNGSSQRDTQEQGGKMNELADSYSRRRSEKGAFMTGSAW